MKHAAYAADLAGKSTILQLKDWWDKVERFGPFFGYFPKASKSWLVVKENNL